MTQTYIFSSTVWMYTPEPKPGNPRRLGAWHFVTLPSEMAVEIDDLFAHVKYAWGSIKVLATIGATSWNTSIFPDKKIGSYFLPLKAVVRKKENISINDLVKIKLEISSR